VRPQPAQTPVAISMRQMSRQGVDMASDGVMPAV
jgi:hypothetical protein